MAARSIGRALPGKRFSIVIAAGLSLAACQGTVTPGANGDRDPDGSGGDAKPGAVGGAPGVVPPISSPSAQVEAACKTPNVAKSRLRRITRTAYNNAVLHVFGDASEPGRGFASDEKVGAFFANTAAPIGESNYMQYVEAAEAVGKAFASRIDKAFRCKVADKGDVACAREFVEHYGLRLFARPITSDEAQRFLTVYEQAKAGSSHSVALGEVVTALLQSPHFLYRLENGQPLAGTNTEVGLVRLDDYALAARLAAFLWQAPPDEALLSLAASQKLGSPEVLSAEAMRLMKDAKFAATARSFFEQWLRLDRLAQVIPDEPRRKSVQADMNAFIDKVFVPSNARFRELFTSRDATLDATTKELYGASNTSALPAAQRAGLLTRAAFLASNRHVPTRGKFIVNELFCNALEVPPDVDTTLKPPATKVNPRERFTQHQSDAQCRGCHALIDPPGNAFWHYDEEGHWQDTVEGWKVDATATITNIGDIDGPVDGAIELSEKVAASKDAAACFARQWFRFAMGRDADEDADACSLALLRNTLEQGDGSFASVLSTIPQLPAFRFVRLAQ